MCDAMTPRQILHYLSLSAYFILWMVFGAALLSCVVLPAWSEYKPPDWSGLGDDSIALITVAVGVLLGACVALLTRRSPWMHSACIRVGVLVAMLGASACGWFGVLSLRAQGWAQLGAYIFAAFSLFFALFGLGAIAIGLVGRYSMQLPVFRRPRFGMRGIFVLVTAISLVIGGEQMIESGQEKSDRLYVATEILADRMREEYSRPYSASAIAETERRREQIRHKLERDARTLAVVGVVLVCVGSLALLAYLSVPLKGRDY